MSNRPSLDDYVDVAERIQNFKDAHPDGSLQTISWEVTQVGDRTFITYRAAAFRTPDDPKPGHGIAWEPFPGRTPYTKDSELMNAETAAWGRAICALGLVSNRSLASRQEVRNRRADQDAARDAPVSAQEPISDAPDVPVGDSAPAPVAVVDDRVVSQLLDVCNQRGVTPDALAWSLLSVGVQTLPQDPTRAQLKDALAGLTIQQAFKLEEILKGEDDGLPGTGETT